MELSALRHFHETVRTGSIRRASSLLHVAASSVSRSIAALEHELGAPLFERSKRGMRLTAAGEVLSRHTRQVFRDFERVRSAIDDLCGLRRGRVSLFAPEGLVADFLPAVIAAFHKIHPAIAFDVFTGSTDDILGALIDDEADIAITFNAPQRSDVVVVAEYAEPLCCLVAPTHPLAAHDQVSLAGLVSYPLALPTPSFGLRRMVDDALFAAGYQSCLALNTNSLELAKRLAMTGDAVAFMPGFMVAGEVAAGQLHLLRVETALFGDARTAVCVHRDRELPFAARAVLSTLCARFGALGGRACASLAIMPR